LTGFALFIFMVYVISMNWFQVVLLVRYHKFWQARFSRCNLKASQRMPDLRYGMDITISLTAWDW